jgi:hypothetical protein
MRVKKVEIFFLTIFRQDRKSPAICGLGKPPAGRHGQRKVNHAKVLYQIAVMAYRRIPP